MALKAGDLGSGYVYTYDGAPDPISTDALERAAAEHPRVPVRAGRDGPVIGHADISVDDHGMKADMSLDETHCTDCNEPLAFRDGQIVHAWSGSKDCTYRSFL